MKRTDEQGDRGMITRRSTLAAAVGLPMVGFRALAAETPGVSATEIKIGNTVPYSGPASAYSSVGKADAAFFQWLNDQGGIAGRKINFISLDDAYTPPRTVEQTRRLVEDDQVAFVFNALGTPTNTAAHRYLNQKRCRNCLSAPGPTNGLIHSIFLGQLVICRATASKLKSI
jgi:branched-chain amino acid transport system substrate-binding protein